MIFWGATKYSGRVLPKIPYGTKAVKATNISFAVQFFLSILSTYFILFECLTLAKRYRTKKKRWNGILKKPEHRSVAKKQKST